MVFAVPKNNSSGLGPDSVYQKPHFESATLPFSVCSGLRTDNLLTINTLIFFPCFFGKKQGDYRKGKDFSCQANPQNPWERREKRLKKKQGIPCKGKSKEFQKSKERKTRVGAEIWQKNQCSESSNLRRNGPDLFLKSLPCRIPDQNLHSLNCLAP